MNIAGNVGSAITGFSTGDVTQMLAKGLGMGDKASALVGALTDISRGNAMGAIQNLNEAISGVEGGIGALMKNIIGGQQQVPSAHSCCSPSEARTANQASAANAANSGNFLKGLGRFAKGFGIGMLLGGNPLAGLAGGALAALAKNTGRRAKGQCVCNRAKTNKGFARRLGSFLKKTLMLGAGGLGALGVLGAAKKLKGLFKNMLPGLGGALLGGALLNNPITNSIAGGIGKVMSNIGKMMGMGNSDGGMNTNSTDAQRQAKFESAEKGSRFTSSLPPNASFEDKLAAFMMDMVEKQEQKIEDLMKQQNAKGNEGAEGGGRGRSKGGLGGMLGGIGKIAGGIFGGPIGSAIGGMAGNAVGGLFGGGGKEGSTAGAGGTENKGKKSEEVLSQEISREAQKLARLIQTLGNVMKNMHDSAMNSVRKI